MKVIPPSNVSTNTTKNFTLRLKENKPNHDDYVIGLGVKNLYSTINFNEITKVLNDALKSVIQNEKQIQIYKYNKCYP